LYIGNELSFSAIVVCFKKVTKLLVMKCCLSIPLLNQIILDTSTEINQQQTPFNINRYKQIK